LFCLFSNFININIIATSNTIFLANIKDNSMSDFQYDLLLESDSIRLLLLQPSSDSSSDIHCSLLHTSLAECNDEIIDQYTALSYVWGDPEYQKTIYVNGQTVHITLNLFHALRDLRDANRVHRLWVDAICINQSDHQERNRQVGIMGSIYSVAHHTVIYLGERSVDSDAVLKVLRGSPEESDARPGLLALAEREILTRPWFTRVWIFQELVLSRDPWIQLGTSRLRWDDFCNCLERLWGNRASAGNPQVPSIDASILDVEKGQAVTLSMASVSQSAHSKSSVQQSSGDSTVPVDVPIRRRDNFKVLQDMQATRKMFRIKQLNPKGDTHTLLDILLARRGFGTTDARDMIFGHLGIAADSAKELGVSADYDISAVQLFTKVAKSIIVHSLGLGFLLYVQDVDPALRRFGLPSWIPDWTSTEFHDFHFVSLWTKKSELIVLNQKLMSKSAKHPHFKVWDEEPAVLAVAGWHRGSIVATSPIILQENCDLDSETRSLWSPTLDLKDLRAIYSKVYNAWRRTSGFELLPSFDVYKKTVPRHMNFLHDLLVKEAQWGFYDTYSLASLLVLHTLSEKATGRSCSLSGRRIAALSNGNIAIVPGSSLPGDLVCRFERFLDHWILRDKDGFPSHSAFDRQVVHQFNDYEDGKPKLSHRGMVPRPDNAPTHAAPTHVVFIGESFVDKTVGDHRPLGLEPSRIFIIH
jgi:hypothetical protein